MGRAPGVKGIILVEERLSIAELLKIVLASRGHRLEVVGTAAETLHAFGEGSHSLVLIDLDADGMSMATMRRIVDAAHSQRMAVVLMSTDYDTRPLMREWGVAAWLPMPFDVDKLLQTVDDLVD